VDEHRKLSAGDMPAHPHHVNVDLSGLTDEELELGERLAITITSVLEGYAIDIAEF
jgi:hypothetical protein